MGEVISITRVLSKKNKTLYVSEREGKIYGSPHSTPTEHDDRVDRIRTSLDKINRLMKELKKISQKENT